METIIAQAREVAVAAAEAAGQLAKARFDSGFTVNEKGEHGDLVTEVDEQAERLIIGQIRAVFPQHAIRGEETGLTAGADADWLWMIDPLDGTNNFAIGLPVFGVCVTLLHRGQPVLGVIRDSHLEKTYVAVRGEGATCNGVPLLLPERRPVTRKLTLSWIQGHVVQQNRVAKGLKWHLEMNSKRIMAFWAPYAAWTLLARGEIDGIVLYNSEGEDLYAGVLLAQEAGATVVDYDGAPFVGTDPEPYLIACHPDQLDELMALVKEGLRRD